MAGDKPFTIAHGDDEKPPRTIKAWEPLNDGATYVRYSDGVQKILETDPQVISMHGFILRRANRERPRV